MVVTFRAFLRPPDPVGAARFDRHLLRFSTGVYNGARSGRRTSRRGVHPINSPSPLKRGHLKTLECGHPETASTTVQTSSRRDYLHSVGADHQISARPTGAFTKLASAEAESLAHPPDRADPIRNAVA